MRCPIHRGDEAGFTAFLDENLAEGHLDASRWGRIEHYFIGYVAERGTVGMMRIARERGFPIDASLGDGYGDCQSGYPNDGATPLFYAAYYGNSDMVRYLLDAGVDVDARDEFGATALMGVVSSCNARSSDAAETVRILLEYGADANAADDSGNTVLLYAEEMGGDYLLPLLREAGATERGSNGRWVEPGERAETT